MGPKLYVLSGARSSSSPVVGGPAAAIVLVMMKRPTPARIGLLDEIYRRPEKPLALLASVAPNRAPSAGVANDIDVADNRGAVPDVDQIADASLS